MIIATSFLSAMENKKRKIDHVVTLYFDNKQEPVEVEKTVLEQSITLKDMMEDFEDQEKIQIPLPSSNITFTTWQLTIQPALQLLADIKNNYKAGVAEKKLPLEEKIEEEMMAFLEEKEGTAISVDQKIKWYIDTINSANYLDIPDFLRCAIQRFTEYLIKKDPTPLNDPKVLEYLSHHLPLDMLSEIVKRIPFLPIDTTITFTTESNGKKDSVIAVDLNRQDTLLASGSNNGLITLWNITNPHTPQLLSTIDHQTTRTYTSITAVRFNPQGNLLASASYDNTIKLWDITNPKTPQLLSTVDSRIGGHTDFVSSVVFDSQGTLLVSASYDKTIKLWDITYPNAPQLLSTVDSRIGGHADTVSSIALHPVKPLLVSGSSDSSIKLWDIADSKNPKLRYTISQSTTGNAGEVSSLMFNRQGNVLAAGLHNKIIKLWDSSDPENPILSSSINSNIIGILSLAFNPQSTILASASASSAITFLNIINGNSLNIDPILNQDIPPSGFYVSSIVFNTRGNLLAGGLTNGTIKLWNIIDIKTLTPIQQLFLYGVKKHFYVTNQKYRVPAESSFLQQLIQSFPDTEKSYLTRFIEFTIQASTPLGTSS
jgi:WD40 repeat protein